MWNLKVNGTDVVSYNQHFQELALMCSRMFPEESNKIERCVGGLPDMIHESVMASKPKTMQDVVDFATELLDKKIYTFAELTGQMANSVALVVFGSTWTIMVIVAFKAQRFRPSTSFYSQSDVQQKCRSSYPIAQLQNQLHLALSLA
nr:reverse transcriptase domain-containing protein [Tanacetum cinerariifolium]